MMLWCGTSPKLDILLFTSNGAERDTGMNQNETAA
jgi:hypothetical protein